MGERARRWTLEGRVGRANFCYGEQLAPGERVEVVDRAAVVEALREEARVLIDRNEWIGPAGEAFNRAADFIENDPRFGGTDARSVAG